MKRRTVLATVSSLATLGIPGIALSQEGQIRIVVPAPAGGPIYVQARALAQEMGKTLNTAVIVDAKPGAGLMLGSGEVARSAPDGRTLLLTTDQSLTQTPHTLLKPQFDPQKDLPLVIRTALVSFVLFVHPSIPGNSVRELVEYARQNPGKVGYATYGAGSPGHIYGEMLARTAKIDIIHIPYKGVQDAVADMLTGRVLMSFNSPALISQYVPEKLKVIATTGDKRTQGLPNLPTMLEQGFPGFETTNWVGMCVPAGVRPEVVVRLRGALVSALKSPAVVAMWKQQAFDFPPENESVAEANTILKRDYERWGRLIHDVGIQPQ